MKNEFIKNKLKEQRKSTQGVQNRPAEKKKGITYYFALVILFFCLLGSSFGFIYAFKDMSSGCTVAHADDNDLLFTGTNIQFSVQLGEVHLTNGEVGGSNITYSMPLGFSFSDTGNFLITNFGGTSYSSGSLFYQTTGGQIVYINSLTDLPLYGNLGCNVNITVNNVNYDQMYCMFERTSELGNIVGCVYGCTSVNQITDYYDHYKFFTNVNGTNYSMFVPTVSTNSVSNYFYIKYFDKDGNYISFQTLSLLTDYYYTNYPLRTYFFDTALSESESYDLGYNQGKVAGLNDNQKNIYDKGYEDGNSIGDSQGYNRGYQQGILDAGTHTFLSLTGAVLDAPVRVFLTGADGSGGLINFDFLGFNMATFFMSLVTLAIIIFVIKLFLGGK